MDRSKRARKPLRAVLTRTINEVNTELEKEVPDHHTLMVKLSKLEQLQPEIMDLDSKILDEMLDGESTEDEYEAEIMCIEEYKDKITDSKLKINAVLHPREPSSPTESVSGMAPSHLSSHSGMKRTYKLPKIEIKKFNGEFLDWLGFWSQFKKIHEDENLHESDKYQYLVQAMTPGTRALDLVTSYPQTAENYQKVVKALKERYGKDKILRQVYVRELLKMVITNNNAREKIKIVQLHDRLESHLRALESLGTTNDPTEFLFPLVESSLQEDILLAWQRSPFYGKDGTQENPPKKELDYLMEFLRKEVENESQRTLVQTGFMDNIKEKLKGKKANHQDGIPTVAGLYIGDKVKCAFCDKTHESKDCGSAQKMSLEEKRVIIGNKRCCFLCLRSGHQSKKCKVFVKCPICDQKHTVIMCPELPAHKKENKSTSQNSEPVTTVSDNLACSSQVILGTLLGTIIEGNREKQVRIFFDSGSQRNYVLKKVSTEMKFKSQGEENLIHSTFGGVKTGVQKHNVYNIKLQNADRKGVTIFPALDKDKICGDIPRMPKGSWMNELKEKGIWVSDIGNSYPEIDILLGANMFARLFTGNKFQLQNGLTAVETTLGWTLMGECNDPNGNRKESLAMTVVNMHIAEASAEQLWSLETIGIKDSAERKSKEESEAAVKLHFKKTVAREEDGRYTVGLPWIDGVQKIPNNRAVAEKRLEGTTRKLKSAGEFEKYGSIFKSWLEEGIIEEVPHTELEEPSYYLPHRPVFKPESLTTPVRPVFDASSKAGRAPSLNDCLEKGPNLLELIPSVLHRFRQRKLGVVSDIRKAFQMINVKEEDRNYLRFLWWEDNTDSTLKIYRHRRVVFGVNSSPFLLAAVLDHHLDSIQDHRRPIALKLLESMYVDNSLTSVDTLEEYEEFKVIATELMAEAKMDLRQWEVTSGEESGIGSMSIECGLETGSNVTSVLGIRWNKYEDVLSSVQLGGNIPEKITKRVVLSEIQKIFDPMGFLCPALLPPKLIMQKVWAVKTDWDDPLAEDIREEFMEWWEEAKQLSGLKIPRHTGDINMNTAQLHCFGDACKDAYAATVFLRVEDGKGISVQLLQAKTRVAPLKPKALGVPEVKTFYWTDSTTALAWIKGNNEWGTFVGNRVKEICTLTDTRDWNHVPGIINPADLPSRGCKPSQLIKTKWWEGPEWLKDPEDKWPMSLEDPDLQLVNQEKRKTAAINLEINEVDVPWYLKRYSSFIKNIRLLAWIRRFLDKCSKKSKEVGELTREELFSAERKIYGMVQDECFPSHAEVIGGIKVEFCEDEGLYKVITKLLYREDCLNFIKPVLLPNSHPVVEQIIREEHLTHQHAGAQFLLSKIREKCWILQGRKAIRKVIGSCVRCRRFSIKAQLVPAAALPEDRINTGKVFQVTGVDLAGPLYLKSGTKTWIVLFTCAVYRCVHLELVQTLQTDTFILALHRFISRRGRPKTIYSDNGTNFVGAVNAFKTLDWKMIQKDTRIHRIQWRFNPPSAPWWGGWWERLVRTVKDLLKRTLGHQRLTYVQLESCLCEVEAVVNSRPLTYITEDQDDLIPLTPAMFMQDLHEVDFPEDMVLGEVGFRRAFNELTEMRESLRSRFRKEYLSLLVQRGKEKKSIPMEVGDIVLVGSENTKRQYWPMAKIIEFLPGKDGKYRVAKVKTARGILLRPLQRLYPMEVSKDFLPVSSDVKEKAKKIKTSPPKEVRTRIGRTVKVPQRFGALMDLGLEDSFVPCRTKEVGENVESSQ